MLELTKITAVACVSLLVVACVEKAGEDTGTDPGTETSAAPDTEPTAATQIVEPTATVGETVDTEPATEPATEPGATDPSDSDPSDTDPVPEDTDTDDTGMAIPEDCAAEDDSVTAEFSLEIGAWPDMADDGHDIDVVCSIDAMAVEPDVVVHSLTCDDAGTPRPVTLTTALPIGGSAVWQQGDSVRLKSRRVREIDFGIDSHDLRLFSADEVPLVIARQGGAELEPNLDPIAYSPEFVCGAEDVDVGQPGLPFAVRFELGASSVSIVSGQRDELAIAGDTAVYLIDLEEATTNYCCHFTRKYHVLIQRVMPL